MTNQALSAQGPWSETQAQRWVNTGERDAPVVLVIVIAALLTSSRSATMPAWT